MCSVIRVILAIVVRFASRRVASRVRRASAARSSPVARTRRLARWPRVRSPSASPPRPRVVAPSSRARSVPVARRTIRSRDA